MKESEGLKASDLLVTFVVRRVLPLQRRPHMISQMSGHRDPCQTCTKEMPTTAVALLVNEIVDLKLDEVRWRFGKWLYSCADPPPPPMVIS